MILDKSLMLMHGTVGSKPTAFPTYWNFPGQGPWTSASEVAGDDYIGINWDNGAVVAGVDIAIDTPIIPVVIVGTPFTNHSDTITFKLVGSADTTLPARTALSTSAAIAGSALGTSGTAIVMPAVAFGQITATLNYIGFTGTASGTNLAAGTVFGFLMVGTRYMHQGTLKI